MCIVSDRHESILKATSVVYPEVPHYVCIFHLWNNIKLRFKKSQKKIRPIFFAMAKAYTTEEFNQHMVEICNLDGRVKQYLFDIGYDRWSVAHSTVNRSMVMTSNIAESMNSTNKAARDLSIHNLLDYLMKLVASWNNTNRNRAMATGTTLSTKYEILLRDRIIASRRMTVIPSNEHLFTVIDDGRQFVVCMRERQCSCRRFQMDVIPCEHALAIVTKYHMDEYQYCPGYCTKDYVLKTYEIPVYPIPDESQWEIPGDVFGDVVKPPKVRVKPGRPKKMRRKGVGEFQ
uniref:SWIM-type domain-containing protein n=1 Tax=Nicotiana tabacum TaxID=4097 RepID=A0A1S3Y989_TOBAC